MKREVYLLNWYAWYNMSRENYQPRVEMLNGFYHFLTGVRVHVGDGCHMERANSVPSILIYDGRGQRERTISWKGRKNDNLVYGRS